MYFSKSITGLDFESNARYHLTLIEECEDRLTQLREKSHGYYLARILKLFEKFVSNDCLFHAYVTTSNTKSKAT